MNNDEFQAVLDIRVAKIDTVLKHKADEYARGDRLSNFKAAAEFLNTTPEKALMGIAIKHIIALRDFINDLDNDLCQPYERWEEKIGDIINYLILLDALVQERHKYAPAP